LKTVIWQVSLLLLAPATWGCDSPSPWLGADGGQPQETDNGVCNPTVQHDWGQTCVPYENTCPAHTICQTVVDLGNALGICSTECCGPDDHARCPDIAPGLEKCVIEDTYYNRWYCAVVCHDSSDCPDGQSCRLANNIDKICYPSQPGN